MSTIHQWLSDPARDYAEGAALFARHSPNKALARYFQHGTARFRMDRLVYEMGKLAKTAAAPTPAPQPPRPVIATSPVSVPVPVETGCAPSPQRAQPATVGTPLPPFILAAKKEISALYALIDKQHRELYDLGTSNAGDVVRKRKMILDGRKPAIERADRLYRLKEEWFALDDGPARERVAKEIREMLAAPPEEQPAVGIGNSKLKIEKDDGVRKMTDLELSKRRTQLRSSITKTRNMLDFQTIRKGDTPAPMPDGPKRDEYERKLAALRAEMTAVCNEIERRNEN